MKSLLAGAGVFWRALRGGGCGADTSSSVGKGQRRRVPLLDVLLQDGFGGWGFTLLDFLSWQDVVQVVATTNHEFRAALKSNYALTCDKTLWQLATMHGWRRITQVEATLSGAAFPTDHLRSLTCCDEIQIDIAASNTCIVCPEVRCLTLKSGWAYRHTRARSVREIMAAAEMLSPGRTLSELELWQYVANHTTWRCVTPRLERLVLGPDQYDADGAQDEMVYATSVLVTACFRPPPATATLMPPPPLQQLELWIPMSNDAMAVHIMAHLALSLRVLSVVVVLDENASAPRPWLWEVTSWPDLRELSVIWERHSSDLDNDAVPYQFKSLHAPNLHTLHIVNCKLGVPIGALSAQTRDSLRSLTLEFVGEGDIPNDLATFPATLESLSMNTSWSFDVDTPSPLQLPSGLRELKLFGYRFARPPSRSVPIVLPHLRRLVAQAEWLRVIVAPRLREVVWNSSTKAFDLTPATRQVLENIKHVTYIVSRNTRISGWFQPWVTRINLHIVMFNEQQLRPSWLECPRLRAVHLSGFARWQSSTHAVRAWAHKHGLEFWLRECSFDDD